MTSIIHLPFHRPLYPRLSLRNFSRQVSTTHCLYNKATSTAIAATSVPPAQDPMQAVPYHIHRTASQKLPVYQLKKRGGNLLQTKLKKIDGDIAALRIDLQRALGLKEEHIVIHQLTKHIIIKGLRKPEVSNFLEQMRF